MSLPWSLLATRSGRRVIGVVAALTVIAGGAWWLHHSGYQSGYAAHRAETVAATRALNQRLARSQDALRGGCARRVGG